MSQQGIVHRQSLILEKIKQNQFTPMADILDFLNRHGFEHAQRTIERDIRKLREEFGVEITSDKYNRGYYIDKEKSADFESLLNFMELSVTAELFGGKLGKINKNIQHISFDKKGDLKGITHLNPLLKAIREHRKITFRHTNFHINKSRLYTIKPYLLRQYQNRWYIIGIIANLIEFKTFGIDRISDLTVQTNTFIPNPKLNPLDDFDQIVGLTYSYGKREKVILSFTATQGKYIQALPIHPSQKELVNNETEYRISLNLIPNYELSQQILMYGDTVKVIEPQHLVDDIKTHLKRAYENYQ